MSYVAIQTPQFVLAGPVLGNHYFTFARGFLWLVYWFIGALKSHFCLFYACKHFSSIHLLFQWLNFSQITNDSMSRQYLQLHDFLLINLSAKVIKMNFFQFFLALFWIDSFCPSHRSYQSPKFVEFCTFTNFHHFPSR